MTVFKVPWTIMPSTEEAGIGQLEIIIQLLPTSKEIISKKEDPGSGLEPEAANLSV